MTFNKVAIFFFILFLAVQNFDGQTVNFGERLRRYSPHQEKIQNSFLQALSDVRELQAAALANAARTPNPEEREFWQSKAVEFARILKASASIRLVVETGCPGDARGCTTWHQLSPDTIQIRLGLGIRQEFPAWSRFEWLELVAHELSHVADLEESFLSQRPLTLFATEFRAFWVSSLCAWLKNEKLRQETIVLWQPKLAAQNFGKQTAFITSAVTLIFEKIKWYAENKNELVFIPASSVHSLSPDLPNP